MPTTVDKEGMVGLGAHESVMRSYHILDLVMTMIERGDSVATIQEMVEYLREV